MNRAQTVARTADRADTEHVRGSAFVLSRPHGTVEARGSLRRFDHASAAAAALRSGEVSALAGALPFAREAPCSLVAPERLYRSQRVWAPTTPRAAIPHFTVEGSGSGTNDREHLDRVRTAVGVLRDERAQLRKVVLARSLTLSADTDVDPSTLLAGLVSGNPSGNGYLVDLSAAGGSWTGRTLVGSSPEVLVRKQGTVVTCHPLAGSAPRHDDPVKDRAAGEALAASAKDMREHAFVVDALREALEPFCRVLDIPDEPTLTRTPQLWHLGTPIRGEVRDTTVSALDLATALHPTPAVCGTPTDLAYRTIDELEGDRGFYAGAVGWCTADGDGEWMVAIRCAVIGSDRRRVTAYAGGGIVAESDPAAELRETNVKFGTVMSALGVQL